jgi:dipeptidase E
MRLFLASQDFGNHANKLRELAGDNRRTLFIINARDEKSDVYRQEKIAEKRAMLENNGFEWCGELDLREYFDKKAGLEGYLDGQNIGHIHVTGGNTFLLRKAFALSGFDSILKNELAKDNLVYSGSSAGSMIMTPDFKYYAQGDRPKIKAAGYPEKIIWQGLGLVREYICPHYSTSDHREVSKSRKADFDKDEVPYILLSDSDVYVVDGNKKEVLR